MVQLVKCLPSMHEAMGLIPGTPSNWKWWCVPANPSTQEVKAGRSEFQGQPQLHGYLDYM